MLNVEGLPTVEGFTPQVLWTTLYGICAIGLLFLIAFKVYDAVHTIRERRRTRIASEKPDFAKKVSQEVTASLDHRFDEINKTLEKHGQRLDEHDRIINSIKDGHIDTHDGLAAIAKFLLVLSNYGDFGDSEKIKEASTDLQKFLAEKI